jgi:hypothetical protein
MKIFSLFLAVCCFVVGVNAATLSSKKEQKFQQATQTVASIKQYISSQAENYNIEGFQAFMGRKLTAKEKKLFKLYKATDPLTPEEEVEMLRNKRLAMWSMIMGVAGFVFVLIPYLSVLSPFLFPAALITGIVTLNRAGKYENKRQSGFGNALAGIILGGVGIMMVFIAILVLLALL